MQTPDDSGSILGRIPATTQIRRRRWRMAKDTLARYGVSLGGMGAIIAIVLIFFYLLYVVLPLLESPDAQEVASYPAGEAQTLLLAMEEQAEIGVRVSDDGRVRFFSTLDGSPVTSQVLPLPAGTRITSVASAEPSTRLLALGLSDGRALVLRHDYKVSFPNDMRLITPRLDYPLGETPLVVDPRGQALTRLAVGNNADRATVAAATGDGRLLLVSFSKEVSFLDDSVTLERSEAELANLHGAITHMLMDPDQRHLFVAGRDGRLGHYDIVDPEAPRLEEQMAVVSPGQHITSLSFLAGGISLMVGDSSGQVSQWFPVRDANNISTLTRIRGFSSPHGPARVLAPEYFRKGFLTAHADGYVGIHHTTAQQTVLMRPVADSALRALAVSPRANAMLAEDEEGKLHFWRIHNEHPEVSFNALWRKVWYESYEQPDYIWQSSSASNDFEPKFSLTPLAFGTLKAAFYAMLFAMPLAILGAVYTAYFMAPRMRRLVKPTVEIMEALPTVILGFLAGLWLAPFMEDHLPGMVSLLLLMPLGVLLVSYLWFNAPARLRQSIPDGWEAALLVPVVLLIGWGSLALSVPLEALLFGGDVQNWMSVELGISYDQRNSLVVGLAMGFAVIPTIFSIAEDAIFNVPKHLSYGSLALGATPWQTLVRVVLLTASPGIFSAVMIGLGRAVGETMIVLMATGNTPVMDFSIFQGMRTLSANIAVEMPESEVGSTHYRILFLAALVLFLFTFLFNTGAEIIRHRLRRKYSSL